MMNPDLYQKVIAVMQGFLDPRELTTEEWTAIYEALTVAWEN